MQEVSLISAFIAGLITFLAPCTLPLVPAYLGFISGVPPEELKNPETSRRAQFKIFLNGLFFVIGFTLVFVIFGTLVGLIGQSLVQYRILLTQISGVFVILFGLFMLGVFKLKFLQVEKHIKTPSWLKLGKPSSSLIIGGAFAFGWTPCVGPILGSILLLASTSQTAIQGGFFLLVFSLGLAVPFLLTALAFSRATQYIKKISKYLNVISKIGGVFLIIIGIFLVTDDFSRIIEYGYWALEFINYDGILNHL